MFPKALLKNGTGLTGSLTKGQPATIRVSPLLADIASKEADEVLRLLETSSSGLTQAEAEKRLEKHGPNEVAQEKQRGWLIRLLITTRNPLVILLLAACHLSFFTGDLLRRAVMRRDGALGRWRCGSCRKRGPTAAAKLKAMISVTATVVRDGQAAGSAARRTWCPATWSQLAAGDMIPADVRVVSCKDLFVIQASLTGESFPVEKFDAREDAARPVAAGAEERLLPGHQRRERRGHGAWSWPPGCKTYLGSMAQSHRRPADRRPASTGASAGSPG